MSILLRIAAAISLAWALWLFWIEPAAVPELKATPAAAALARGLGIANFGFALLFWRAARNPPAERSAIYTALLVCALRGATGTVEVLYRLDGRAAVVSLIDMVTCIALFVGILNSLPGTLRAGSHAPGAAGEQGPAQP